QSTVPHPQEAPMLPLILTLLTFAPQDQPTDARTHLQRGTALAGKRQFKEAGAEFRACLRLDPKNAHALDRPGNRLFLLGQFKESVAAFDDLLKLQPRQANGHWRRGISLYYAGQFEAGRKQFEGYEKVDTNDVENAVWHFLCAARKDGLKKARA